MPVIALISDIHGNLPALNAVLKELDARQPDEWLCLGDLVGYGPSPAECVQIIMDREIPSLMGNHDAGVSGKLTVRHFREPNRSLIEMSKTMLSGKQLEWLANRPLTLHKPGQWLAAHATPAAPDQWIYIDSAVKARNILNEIEEDLCFVGHTHVPALVSSQIGSFEFKAGNKHLINPGSVGQSRDGDPRASCVLIDTDNFTYENIRIEYDNEETLAGLTKLGFDKTAARRLLRL